MCLSHPPLLCRLLNPLAAILISVTAILVFAEIMPQVSCVGQVRYLQQSVLAAMLSAEVMPRTCCILWRCVCTAMPRWPALRAMPQRC